MKSIITYDVIKCHLNDELRKIWSINEASIDAYFLCRITKANFRGLWEVIDTVKISVFSLNSEAELCREWLHQNVKPTRTSQAKE